MGIRFTLAKATAGATSFALRRIARRTAGNLPGKLALPLDPQLIRHLSGRCSLGTIVVVGTNGKTSTNNLIADAIEATGHTVICNRAGANLDSGIATALLQTKSADWGVIECDELWLAKVLPQLRANFVLLLNLFRDQLDRCGEIDIVQDRIVEALQGSPETTLIFNADDPLCAIIAGRVSNPKVSFGMGEDMRIGQNTVSDAKMCQRCSSMLAYEYRQYGQLGKYHCPTCGFERPEPTYSAREVSIDAEGVRFSVYGQDSLHVSVSEECEDVACGAAALADASTQGDAPMATLHSAQPSPYVAYNHLAAFAAIDQMGFDADCLQRAIDAFNPRNGRLQTYRLKGRRVLLNLAKNPTGFNQNLKIIQQDPNPKAVGFFINDRTADGHDISWLWDVDFEELVSQSRCLSFAGGLRSEDMQVRLKYAGVKARRIANVQELLAMVDASDLPPSASVYLVANYTALPEVHNALDAMEASQGEACASVEIVQEKACASEETLQEEACANVEASQEEACVTPEASKEASTVEPLVIAHLFPDLLNLYGDGGNVRILEQRCAWRGIPVQIKRVEYGDDVDLSLCDLVFLAGAPDREQRLASQMLMDMREDLVAFIASKGALLAICGGYQILGSSWILDGESVPGLNLAPLETRRAGTSSDRLVGNIVLESPLATHPVVGYENHAGRTFLNQGATPFGKVVSSTGFGNNDAEQGSRADGVLDGTVVATYLHGPLLSKNPEIADALLERAIAHWSMRTGRQAFELAPLDDAEELGANAALCRRLGVK